MKPDEYRVGMMPVGAETLVRAGHEVMVEAGAGLASGFPDDLYAAPDAAIVPSAEEVHARGGDDREGEGAAAGGDRCYRKGQIVFTYFHFAADRELTLGCVESGIVAVAYETIKDRRGRCRC